MAVLRVVRHVARALLVLAAGCYSPETPDCTLGCAADSDCIASQACTTDHRCAAPSIATCGRLSPIDAAAVTDGRLADASPFDAGPTLVMLSVHTDGNGAIEITGNVPCDKIGMPVTCTYQVPIGIELTVTAIPHSTWVFEHWTGGLCDGQGATCHATPTAMATVNAKFKHD